MDPSALTLYELSLIRNRISEVIENTISNRKIVSPEASRLFPKGRIPIGVGTPCPTVDLGLFHDVDDPRSMQPILHVCEKCSDPGKDAESTTPVRVALEPNLYELTTFVRVALKPTLCRIGYGNPVRHKVVSDQQDYFIYTGQCDRCRTIYYGIYKLQGNP